MLKGTLIKTSLVDFPGRVAATYFLSGCNIRCPYCYNGELALNQVEDIDLLSLEEVYEHLIKRKNVLTGFVLSGGEPLIYPQIAEVIKAVKDMGYNVKLDTNGLLPENLELLFSSKDTTPDYIAIDIKTAPSKYNLLKYEGNAYEKISRTIEIVKQLPTEQREFRTVLCPPLIDEDTIVGLAELLPKDARWFFAQFRNENCLDASYNTVTPYADKCINELVSVANKIIPQAKLR